MGSVLIDEEGIVSDEDRIDFLMRTGVFNQDRIFNQKMTCYSEKDWLLFADRILFMYVDLSRFFWRSENNKKDDKE